MHIYTDTHMYLPPVHHLCCMLQCIAELFNMLGTCREGEGGQEAGAASAVAVYCQAQRSQCSRPGTGRKVTTIY